MLISASSSFFYQSFPPFIMVLTRMPSSSNNSILTLSRWQSTKVLLTLKSWLQWSSCPWHLLVAQVDEYQAIAPYYLSMDRSPVTVRPSIRSPTSIATSWSVTDISPQGGGTCVSHASTGPWGLSELHNPSWEAHHTQALPVEGKLARLRYVA